MCSCVGRSAFKRRGERMLFTLGWVIVKYVGHLAALDSLEPRGDSCCQHVKINRGTRALWCNSCSVNKKNQRQRD